jgi:hypothetical protein
LSKKNIDCFLPDEVLGTPDKDAGGELLQRFVGELRRPVSSGQLVDLSNFGGTFPQSGLLFLPAAFPAPALWFLPVYSVLVGQSEVLGLPH